MEILASVCAELLGLAWMLALTGTIATGPAVTASTPTAGAETFAATAAQAAPPSRIPDSVRRRDTIAGDAEAVCRIDNEPIDPALKGFFAIPGTATRLKIGGYFRVDTIHDFEPIGSTDQFILRTIPVDVDSDSDNTQVHAKQTRVNLDLRRPTHLGTLRSFLETDFFGPSGERAFQLRHAYGHVANLLVGFTVSTLQDPDAKPDTLDYEGPPALIAVRHAQVRYTRPISSRQSLAWAIEAPKSDVPSQLDGDAVTARTPWPDVVVRYRLDAARGHVQVGAVLRSIGGFAGGGTPHQQVLGGGASLSGSLMVLARDVVTFQVNGGAGLARYVHDTSGGGLDLALDGDGRVRPVPIVAAMTAYQRAWHSRWRSTFAISFVDVDTLEGQPADAYRATRYMMANVIYKPSDTFSVGTEFDVGRLRVKDGRHDTVHRVQVSLQYDFVK